MLILGLVAHFLHVISSPFLAGTIFLLSFMSGSRKIVRGGAGASGAFLTLFAVKNLEPSWSSTWLILIGIAAAMLAAEIWLSALLPAYFGLRAFLSAALSRTQRD
jgi:membrane-bound ClpP family serine protease